MYKRNISGSMALSLVAGLILSFLYAACFADETLTITTYYPSPYGSYQQLTADQIAIGSAYRNPTYADGSLYVQGNVGIGTTSPQTPAPNALAGNLDVNDIYLRSTGKWLSQSGSGGGGVTMMSARSASTYTVPGASAYCYNLSATAAVAMNGDTTTTYTDWRLPTFGEAAVFAGTITATDFIWTGTVYQATAGPNWICLRLSDGYWGSSGQPSVYARCVR